MPRDREAFADVGRATRAVLFAANGAELTVRQHRTLNAVIALTSTYSRTEDRFYLAQVAAFAYGVERAEAWQAKKTREDLAELEHAGLIRKQPPRGRPPAGTSGPSYLIGLGTPETDPDPGVHSGEETDPDPGVHSTPKQPPIPDRNRPRSRTESVPDVGPPTEETSRGVAEEVFRGDTDGTALAHARRRPSATVRQHATRILNITGSDDRDKAEEIIQLVLDHGATPDDLERWHDALTAAVDERADDDEDDQTWSPSDYLGIGVGTTDGIARLAYFHRQTNGRSSVLASPTPEELADLLEEISA